MKLKISALGAAVLALTAMSAQANLTLPSTGNSSIAFVAMDGTNVGAGIAPAQSLTIDLGYTLLDFLPLITGVTLSAGSLSAQGTTVVWDFVNNTRSLNGVADSGTFAWSTPYSTYAGAIQNGSSWGVIGGDTVSGAASGTTPANQTTFSTGNPTTANMVGFTGSSQVSTAVGNLGNFFAANNFSGTNQVGQIGGNVATTGTGFLASTMGDTFGAGSGYNNLRYLTQGSTNFITFVRQQSNSTVYQLGLPTSLDQVSANPASFTFDATAGTLTYVMPVPEPGTYAMLIAGLGAIGLMVRRRTQTGV
jgi:hypothetical protein